jgi:hypothetical protein
MLSWRVYLPTDTRHIIWHIYGIKYKPVPENKNNHLGYIMHRL